MSKLNINSKKGFTIIEVVLVLAIAGLIFLMVFIALPALQRSQRDTQRQNDMGRFNTAIANYQANHNGSVPVDGTSNYLTGETGTTFIKEYLTVGGDQFSDPDGTAYTITIDSTPATPTDDTPITPKTPGDDTITHSIYWYTGATCQNGGVVPKTGDRNIAFMYKLEGGGWYCSNN